MPAIKSPPFRADHVGSLLRPQALKDAFRDRAKGKLAEPAFRAIQERAIQEAVALQEDVGLEAITDGEFCRGSWFQGFIEAVDGLTTRPASQVFENAEGDHASWQTAYVEGKLRRTRGITTGEFSFVRGLTKRTPKVTMPTPSLMHFFRGDESVDHAVYPDLEEFWSDLITVYRQEIAALGALGCTYVQLDEVPCAMLCDHKVRLAATGQGMNPDALLERYIDALNAVVADRPAGMTIAVHLCRGNYKGHWMGVGGYDPIAEQLFSRLAVDALFLEYDTERAGGFEPLRFVSKDKRVVLGLVSTKTATLESVDALAQRVNAAARFVPLDRLAISPQCGFASSVAGNPLTIDDERAKLARVVEVARRVWG